MFSQEENFSQIFIQFFNRGTENIMNMRARAKFPFRGENLDDKHSGIPLSTRPSFHVTEKPPQRCTYPSWVVTGKSWVALDRMASRLLASPYNLTILDRNETRLVCHSVVRAIDDRSMLIDRENQKQFVAKVTRDW